MAAVNYSLYKAENKYFIVNEENLPIYVSMIQDGVCFPTTVTGYYVEPTTPWEIPFPCDGYYHFNLASQEFPGNFSDLYIKYFEGLLDSMIQEVETALCPCCGCGCSDCSEDEADNCSQLLTTRSKIDTYRYSMGIYEAPIIAVHQGTYCDIMPVLSCDISKEGVTGQDIFNEKLTKQLIAIDYLAIYYWEVKNTPSQEQRDYLAQKFKIDEIICCIVELGLDVNKIKQIIENMATMTMNTAEYENQAPSEVGDNGITANNRTNTVYTRADFTSGTTPPYSDPEGDPAYQVRIDSLPTEGVLLLNGTPLVTGDLGNPTAIINLDDVDLGVLVYQPPSQDPAVTGIFNFSVNDTVNQTFIS